MAIIPVVDCLFSIESPSTFVQKKTCGEPLPDLIASMDRDGVSKVLLAPCKRWKCERHWVCGEIQVDEVRHYVESQPARFAGLAGYNPFAIVESLQQVEQALQELDFRGVYVHTEGSDVKLRDRRMYPLYALCAKMIVPVVLQVSDDASTGAATADDVHSVMTDFPDLTAVLAWNGTAGLESLRKVCERHSSALVAFNGKAREGEERALVEWLRDDGQTRCMWGSNGLPWKTLLDGIVSYSLPSETLFAFLNGNASRTFSLSQPVRVDAFPPREKIATAE